MSTYEIVPFSNRFYSLYIYTFLLCMYVYFIPGNSIYEVNVTQIFSQGLQVCIWTTCWNVKIYVGLKLCNSAARKICNVTSLDRSSRNSPGQCWWNSVHSVSVLTAICTKSFRCSGQSAMWGLKKWHPYWRASTNIKVCVLAGIKTKEDGSSVTGSTMVHEGESFCIREDVWGEQQNVIQDDPKKTSSQWAGLHLSFHALSLCLHFVAKHL